MKEKNKKEGKMKITIKTEKCAQGYRMVAVFENSKKVVYPQNGLVHPTKRSVFAEARSIFSAPSWKWNEKNKTIDGDF